MIELTDAQINGLIRLIDDEIKSNEDSQNDAYNYWWMRLKTKLAKAKTSK